MHFMTCHKSPPTAREVLILSQISPMVVMRCLHTHFEETKTIWWQRIRISATFFPWEFWADVLSESCQLYKTKDEPFAMGMMMTVEMLMLVLMTPEADGPVDTLYQCPVSTAICYKCYMLCQCLPLYSICYKRPQLMSRNIPWIQFSFIFQAVTACSLNVILQFTPNLLQGVLNNRGNAPSAGICH